MNVKIQGGGGGKYANTGSSQNVFDYLEHEDKELMQERGEINNFFTHDRDNVSAKEATEKIDNNRSKLCNSDSKFFVVIIAPSQEEIKKMGNTREEQIEAFKEYVNKEVMRQYADNFGKGLTEKDLMYYAKIHETRGQKGGLQLHAHAVVSRKCANNKLKLSSQTNHQNTTKGAVKGGFGRKDFIQKCEQAYDRRFNYDREFKNTFDYQNTMKHGTGKDIEALAVREVEYEKAREQRQEQTQENKRDKRQDRELTRQIGR